MKLQTFLKTALLFLSFTTFCFSLQAQSLIIGPSAAKEKSMVDAFVHKSILRNYERVRPFFEEAYQCYPTVPKGVLEAVAYSYTRYCSLPFDTLEPDASAMPKKFGVMGLTLNGKGIFRENLRLVADLAGVEVMDLIRNDRSSILAYAAAFSKLQEYFGYYGIRMEVYLPIFVALSELPLDAPLDQDGKFAYAHFDLKSSMKMYPLYSSLYEIYNFLADTSMTEIGLPGYAVDFVGVFGENLKLLRQSDLTIIPSESNSNDAYPDYPSAIWCPAASCNYAAGRTLTPSNVVVHYTSGTYAGTIAWFQNCQSNVSAHYVIRSFDGQVTQMVSEADRAWHVGNENGYTIGIEHEAYGDVASWFTSVMYQSSAALVRNICSRRPIINTRRTFCHDTLDDGTVLNAGLHNLGGSSACTQIRGHQHYPGQSHTDPGPYWNWNYYYKLLNPNDSIHTLTASSGIFTDSGGASGNYSDNERQLTLIHSPGADSLVLEFSSFDLEPDYDFMWIYAGNNVFTPLLGRWNTQNPQRVVAPGEFMLVDFRSDCTTSRPGWMAQWYGITQIDTPNVSQPPATAICWNEDDWVTSDFTLSFLDSASTIQKSFFQVVEKDGNVWTSNTRCGFLCDNFDNSLNTQIWSNDRHWQVADRCLQQSDSSLANAVIFANHNGTVSNAFLFDFYLKFSSSGQCSFYFYANTQSVLSRNFCAYEVVLDKNEHSLSLYKVVNGVRTLLKKQQRIYFASGQSLLYRVVWDSVSKTVKVFRHASLLMTATDVGALPTNTPQYVGFATHNSSVSIDNVRCYVARAETQQVTVGESDTKMIRKQSVNGAPVCKLKSVVLDGQDVFSSLEEKNVKVDYTPPTMPIVFDGLDADVDEAANVNVVSANWTASVDENSGISDYCYYVTVNMSDAYESTNRLQLTNQQHFYQSRTCKIPCLLRVGVMARNNAGLCSEMAYSDGVRYGNPMLLQLFPNPASVGTKVRLRMGVSEQWGADMEYTIQIMDMTGRIIKSVNSFCGDEISIEGLPKGAYVIQVLSTTQSPEYKKLIVE